jgi:hypothetical protein
MKRKFVIIWLLAFLLLLLSQSFFGGIPHGESVSFYIGWFATPFFLGLLIALIALVAFLVFKYWE